MCFYRRKRKKKLNGNDAQKKDLLLSWEVKPCFKNLTKDRLTKEMTVKSLVQDVPVVPEA